MDPDPVETLAAAVDGLLAADLSRLDALGLVDLLRQVLRVTAREAVGRVRAAADLGPRRTLTGDRLPPLFPAVAAAQSAGAISPAHARVITSTVDALPADIQAIHDSAVETFLVEHAAHLDPARLGHAATRLTDTLNPDGTHTDDEDRQRRRELTLHTHRDGTGHLTGTLTPETTAVWQTILDSLSAPDPAADGTRDPRTSAQRRHDGLLDAGHRLLRSGDLPDNGGTPVTITVTITADQLRQQTGHTSTSHGNPISIPALLRLATEADIIPTVLNNTGGILAYGRTRRLATPTQRLALTARDRGCSFPGCHRPATWCQAHHITAWRDGGTTDLNNLTLLCGHHHRQFEQQGWTCHMINGIAHRTPPGHHPPGSTRPKHLAATPPTTPKSPSNPTNPHRQPPTAP